MQHSDILSRFGLTSSGAGLTARSPVDGATLATVAETAPSQVSDIVANAARAFEAWRSVPAPRRGELVRLLGEELRAAKEDLGRLV